MTDHLLTISPPACRSCGKATWGEYMILAWIICRPGCGEVEQRAITVVCGGCAARIGMTLRDAESKEAAPWNAES
jgi:hypothetical protein